MSDSEQVGITLAVKDNLFIVNNSLANDPNRKWLAVFPNKESEYKHEPTVNEELRKQVKLTINPSYGDLDNDTLMVLSRFNLPTGSSVLEVGANEEPTACVLADNGYRVTAVDLRPPRESGLPVNYVRLEGDFVTLASSLRNGQFDACISTSALEHFGLGTYRGFEKTLDPYYDVKAVEVIYTLLKPGGLFFVTVPYGREFTVNAPHWRVYDREALRERIVRDFEVVEKVFFKSADAGVPDDGGYPVPLVREEDADQFEPGDKPHLTVFLCLRKRGN